VVSLDHANTRAHFPQTNNTKKSQAEFGDWLSYLAQKDHSKYVSKIGNLTLIAGALNHLCVK
jgi:Protein of unknown function (DUF1524)